MSKETAKKLLTADEFFDWVMCPENQGRHYELEHWKGGRRIFDPANDTDWSAGTS